MSSEGTLTAPPARRLWDLVAALGVRFGHERSFRVRPGELLGDRFLLSVAKASLGPQPGDAVLDLCGRLRIPADFAGAVRDELHAARFVHFGFEGGSSSLYKLYLEHPAPPDAGEPVLLHRAFKWDPLQPERRAVTRYVWHPRLSAADVLGRVAAAFGGRSNPAFGIAWDVLLAAGERVGPNDLRYLEVVEDDTPRRSFDLNLYAAGLRVADLAAALARMGELFGLPEGRVASLCAELGPMALGHIAGGTHRDGLPFFNVYYGVEG